jgi:hypothetical protein
MIMTTPQDIMLGATWMASTNDGFVMSPEAFIGTPYSMGNLGMMAGSQGSTTDDDFDDSFDINDFVHPDSDEEERDDSSTVGNSPSTRRPSTAVSHTSQEADFRLSSDLVGAFRRNQNNHRLITRNNQTHDSLAFSSPIHEGTLRGIKQGKLGAVHVPITPMRKAKVATDYNVTPTQPEKRKREVSGENSHTGFGHKRTRSMG